LTIVVFLTNDFSFLTVVFTFSTIDHCFDPWFFISTNDFLFFDHACLISGDVSNHGRWPWFQCGCHGEFV
tara:strand:- start:170 stop:379 length:210 start_codon:yes stop_codon:yes gene_type:complete